MAGVGHHRVLVGVLDAGEHAGAGAVERVGEAEGVADLVQIGVETDAARRRIVEIGHLGVEPDIAADRHRGRVVGVADDVGALIGDVAGERHADVADGGGVVRHLAAVDVGDLGPGVHRLAEVLLLGRVEAAGVVVPGLAAAVGRPVTPRGAGREHAVVAGEAVGHIGGGAERAAPFAAEQQRIDVVVARGGNAGYGTGGGWRHHGNAS